MRLGVPLILSMSLLLGCQPSPRKAAIVSHSPARTLTGEVVFKKGENGVHTYRIPAAYSDLVIMRNKDVGVLYEAGETNPYEAIYFARLRRKDLNK